MRMPTQPATIVQRLWAYCKVLRDDGVQRPSYWGGGGPLHSMS